MMKKLKILFILALLPAGHSNAQTPGNALHYNGTNGYVTSTLPPLFNAIPSNDFTIEAWLNPNGFSSSYRVFSAQLDMNNFVSILLNNSNVPYVFLYRNGNVESINTQTPISNGQWSHFAATWDASTTTITCYINGVETVGVYGGSSSIGTDNLMTIGSRTDGNQIFRGSIDELRIWSDIRTQCEIISSMNTTFTSAQPNLIASYSFNQGIAGGSNSTETTLNELNTNFNGTLSGFQLTGSTSNWVSSAAGITTSNVNDGITYLTDVESACNSFLWLDNVTYTSSNNTAVYNTTSPEGCPVSRALDLTINLSNSGTDNVSACDSYQWIDANTYTSSNTTATHTLTNVAGCDSVVTLNLTLGTSNSATDIITACSSYTWINGNNYTSSNSTATYTLTNATGCDSVVTLNLTINNPSASTDIVAACDSFTWMDGNTYTADNNTATMTLQNAAGCDSVVTLNLTINSVDASATANGEVFTATTSGADYQWIDCTNNNIPIAGATDQSYVATSNGTYAVIVSNSDCSDTSACMILDNIGLDELSENPFVLYPNPNDGSFTVSFSKMPSGETIRVVNTLGETVHEIQVTKQNQPIALPLQSGYYFLAAGSQRLSFSVR